VSPDCTTVAHDHDGSEIQVPIIVARSDTGFTSAVTAYEHEARRMAACISCSHPGLVTVKNRDNLPVAAFQAGREVSMG
jgi:hypothetical protein